MPRRYLAHEALAGGGDERDRLGEEDAHRVAERDRLRVRRALDVDAAEAAAVSSTAVLSVSVANCSRCASCTDSACCSANSRSAAEQLLGVAAAEREEAASTAPCARSYASRARPAGR